TIIPGSHKAGRAPHGETSWHGVTPKAVMVKAGDVCLFRGDIWHGSGMNSHETERRYMVQVHYGNAYITKQFPAMRYKELWNPAVVDAATPEQRQLLGDK
ncbi:MAG: phytanoyl-CoA dioxygenase family protein, partial [Akkermansiaceae bacterium]|nr:phytanoyl-CoA dioxygenase family protein [Armatimonadota bacterium]